MTELPAALGRVYDRGYRPYEGTRGGRWAPVGALWRAALRRALGIRRSWRQKVVPWVLLAIVSVPAIVNVGVGYVTRDTPYRDFRFLSYREYVGVSSALLAFVAITAPDIICPERRNRVLPLIFSRPVDGTGYVLAKLGAITFLVFGFGFLPQVVLFTGQAVVSERALDYLLDNTDVLWQVPLAVATLAIYYGALGVAIASLTTRRLVAGVSFLGLLLVSGVVAAIIRDVQGRTAWSAIDLAAVPLHVRDLIFLGYVDPIGPLAGVPGGGALALAVWALVVVGSVATLLVRYREAEAA